jgi:hypothetical protein
MTSPPVTDRSTPWTKLAASDTRRTIAPATSSADPVTASTAPFDAKYAAPAAAPPARLPRNDHSRTGVGGHVTLQGIPCAVVRGGINAEHVTALSLQCAHGCEPEPPAAPVTTAALPPRPRSTGRYRSNRSRRRSRRRRLRSIATRTSSSAARALWLWSASTIKRCSAVAASKSVSWNVVSRMRR